MQDDGITHENFVFVCLNHNAIIWLAISYAYKGLLQLVAMFMAFHTRRVKIKALNDSKEIAVIIYINSITLALLSVVEFALNAYHEVYAALFGLALLVGATLFLTLIFIPKVNSLHAIMYFGWCHQLGMFRRWYIFARIRKVRLCLSPLQLQTES